MRTFGLIGFPLSHSFSEKFFKEKFAKEAISNAQYRLFPLELIELLPALLENEPSICGLNVTIPHKKSVLPLLHSVDESIHEIGAVNCISVERNGNTIKLVGHNTDVYGFEQSLRPLLKPWHTKALILGDGGAAKAVQYVLGKLSIDYKVVSRKPGAFGYAEITPEIMETHNLLINTTPVGMYPDVDQAPSIPYARISKQHLAYDLIYNPANSAFLKKSYEQGAEIKNGLEMLHLQAEKSWYIWNRE